MKRFCLAISLILASFSACTYYNCPSPKKPFSAVKKPAVINDELVVYVYVRFTDSTSVVYGSGFVYGTDGLVVTAYHIVRHPNIKDVFVRFREDGKLIVKKVQWTESAPQNDTALLKIPHKFKTSAAIRLRVLDRAEPIYVLGFPLTGPDDVPLDAKPPVLLGNFFKYYKSKFRFVDTEMYLLDARLAPGNSGGPVFDRNGEVVGIATQTATVKGALFACAVRAKHFAALYNRAALLHGLKK